MRVGFKNNMMLPKTGKGTCCVISDNLINEVYATTTLDTPSFHFLIISVTIGLHCTSSCYHISFYTYKRKKKKKKSDGVNNIMMELRNEIEGTVQLLYLSRPEESYS